MISMYLKFTYKNYATQTKKKFIPFFFLFVMLQGFCLLLLIAVAGVQRVKSSPSTFDAAADA